MSHEDAGDQLRSLISGLKTRSPHEVMGTAQNNSLVGSVITAALGLIGLMIGATVLVFAVFGPPAIREKREAAPIASAVPSAPATTADTDIAAETSTAPADSNVPPGSGTESDPATAMGIGEAKDPDDSTDSLENRLDDLLKGLE